MIFVSVQRFDNQHATFVQSFGSGYFKPNVWYLPIKSQWSHYETYQQNDLIKYYILYPHD